MLCPSFNQSIQLINKLGRVTSSGRTCSAMNVCVCCFCVFLCLVLNVRKTVLQYSIMIHIPCFQVLGHIPILSVYIFIVASLKYH